MLLKQRGRLLVVVATLSALATAMVLAGAGGAAAANPPGNNGTVKIDDTPFDDLPNNEPHVGCVFQVDFYGYDEGDLNATVTFEAQPPTQREGDDQVLLTDTVFIGEDDNSGGGSEAGLDASETYTLDFTGITPHPVQGFHVKLTVHAEGSQGADVKHKVFWVTGCGPSPTTTTTSGSTTSTSKATTTSKATSTSSETSTTSGESTTTSGKSTTTTAAGGSAASTPSSSVGGGGGVLPFTGAGTMPLLLVGLVLLGLGGAALLARAHRA